MLSAKLIQLDMDGFFLAANDVITCQQQGTVVQGEIASESRCRHFADTADFRTGQPGRAI